MGLFQDIAALYPSFNKIPQEHVGSIKEIVFSCRDGVNSICVVFNNANALSAVAPNIPSSILEYVSHRYAVDLESLGTDRERYYVDLIDHPTISIKGWFCNNGEIYQEKNYRRASSGGVEVDRYNVSGELISEAEPEIEATESDWSGHPEVISIVSKDYGSTVGHIFLKKVLTNQTYVRLFGLDE